VADDEDSILLQFWQEQRDHARHTESQRAQMTNLILVITAAGLGLLTSQQLHGRKLLFITIGLAVLGAYGTVITLKYYERYGLHIEYAQLIRQRLNERHPALGIEQDWLRARTEHRRQHPRLRHLRLHYIWAALHSIIAVSGFVGSMVIGIRG
jgi:hypothetical protein